MGKVEVAAQKCIEEEETDDAAECTVRIITEFLSVLDLSPFSHFPEVLRNGPNSNHPISFAYSACTNYYSALPPPLTILY